MYKGSIYTVNDLLDNNGKFLSIQEFETLTGISSNFIEYNGLLMAVRQFKLKLYPNLPAPSYKLQLPLIPNIIQPIKSAKKGCRTIYQFLTKENLEKPTSHAKWENEIDINNKFPWQHIHQLPFKCCLGTSTKWFQYRLCHRILATNTFLHKIGITESNSYSFFKREPWQRPSVIYSIIIQ